MGLARSWFPALSSQVNSILWPYDKSLYSKKVQSWRLECGIFTSLWTSISSRSIKCSANILANLSSHHDLSHAFSIRNILRGTPQRIPHKCILKTLFRLSRVLLELWKCILSDAIKNWYLFCHPGGTWSFSKLNALQCHFPQNFRCSRAFYESENFPYSSLYLIF